MNDCPSSSTVTSGFSGAGGMVGSCDTVYIAACHNQGEIRGATAPKDRESSIGAGGLIGGANIASITSCDNSGTVSGFAGVGGLQSIIPERSQARAMWPESRDAPPSPWSTMP